MNPADVTAVAKATGGAYPQVVYAYDGNENLEYVGIGSWGAATSDAAWRIFKLTYDSNSKILTQKSTQQFQVWDNRTGLTYA